MYQQHDTSIESPYGDYIEEYDEEPPFAYSHNDTYAQRPRPAELSHPTPFGNINAKRRCFQALTDYLHYSSANSIELYIRAPNQTHTTSILSDKASTAVIQ